MSVENTQADEIPIREAKPDDCEQILSLIKELAVYLKMPIASKLTSETLRENGFGDEKMFRCFVAEDNGRLVGFAMYCFIYSSQEGLGVYMEDLYVSPTYRHKNIGTRLWRAVAKVAADRHCRMLDWACLGWNKPAVEFYKSKGSLNLTEVEDWNHFRLCGDNLKAFAKSAILSVLM